MLSRGFNQGDEPMHHLMATITRLGIPVNIPFGLLRDPDLLQTAIDRVRQFHQIRMLRTMSSLASMAVVVAVNPQMHRQYGNKPAISNVGNKTVDPSTMPTSSSHASGMQMKGVSIYLPK